MSTARQRTIALVKCLLTVSLLLALLVLHHDSLPHDLTTVLRERGDQDVTPPSAAVVEPPREILKAWEASWHKALNNGKARLQELYAADTRQSTWENYADLKRYGWRPLLATSSGVHAAVKIPLGLSQQE